MAFSSSAFEAKAWRTVDSVKRHFAVSMASPHGVGGDRTKLEGRRENIMLC
jgi:hypothetical protein